MKTHYKYKLRAVGPRRYMGSGDEGHGAPDATWHPPGSLVAGINRYQMAVRYEIKRFRSDLDRISFTDTGYHHFGAVVGNDDQVTVSGLGTPSCSLPRKAKFTSFKAGLNP
jgi:hypothetical protein